MVYMPHDTTLYLTLTPFFFGVGLRAFKSPVSDNADCFELGMAALEDKEWTMVMQFVTEATYDMAPYPAGEDTPIPFMFWKNKLTAPAYALIKRYAIFFMSCLMYVFSYPI
jgi:hypothetical protein